MSAELFKIAVSIPPEFSDELMDAIDSVIKPIYPGYERTFTIVPVTGTWKPVEGSHPFKGSVGKIEVSEEVRIEFAISKDDIEKVITKIRDVHPYEEPAIDVLPMYGWRDFLIPLA